MHGVGVEYISSRNEFVIRVKGDKIITVPHMDESPVTINSRDTEVTSRDIIGLQVKPNQKATPTNKNVVGAEFSPRCSDAGLGSSGALIGLRADPLLKTATAARTVGAVRCIECNPGLPGSGSAYTVTDLVGIRFFLDEGVGHTVTRASVIQVATPNNGAWEYLLDAEASSGLVVDAAVGGSQDKKLKARIAGTNYFIPLHTA